LRIIDAQRLMMPTSGRSTSSDVRLLLLFDSNEENQALDIKAVQKHRAETSSG